jgi:hypothetical protein
MTVGMRVFAAAAGLVVLIAGFQSVVEKADADGTGMVLDPPSQVVTLGSTVDVSVVVDGVTNLGAYDFELTYDPNILKFSSVNNTPYLGSTGRSAACFGPLLDNEFHDSVRYGCATVGQGIGGPSGTGAVAVVRFETIGKGTSDVTFTFFGLGSADAEAEGIPVSEFGTAAVQVVGTDEPTPPAKPKTPTPNARRLTPTPNPNATVAAGYRLTDPTSGDGSGVASDGSSIDQGGSGTGAGSSGSGSVAGASGAPSAFPGASPRPAGATVRNGVLVGPDGVPIAGYGPGARSPHWDYLIEALVALAIGGWVMREGARRVAVKHRT